MSELLVSVLEDYLAYCHISCTGQTLRQYAMVLAKVVADLGGTTRLISEVTPRELQRYQSAQWGSLKPNTISGYTAILKTFFEWSVERGYLTRSPAAALPRPRRHKSDADPRAIPPDHLRRMLDYARLTSPRNYALLMFLIATGSRVGGALSITLDDLRLDEYRARIRLKGGKLDFAFFGDMTREALETYLAKRPASAYPQLWVWEKKPYRPLEDGGVYAMIVDLCHRISLPREYFTHGTRHSVGISWTKAGVALGIVSAKLHHSDVGITHDYYASPDNDYMAMVSRRYESIPLMDHPEEALGNGRIIKVS